MAIVQQWHARFAGLSPWIFVQRLYFAKPPPHFFWNWICVCHWIPIAVGVVERRCLIPSYFFPLLPFSMLQGQNVESFALSDKMCCIFCLSAYPDHTNFPGKSSDDWGVKEKSRHKKHYNLTIVPWGHDTAPKKTPKNLQECKTCSSGKDSVRVYFCTKATSRCSSNTAC